MNLAIKVVLHFMYEHIYREKFHLHGNYLDLTVKNAYNMCVKNRLLGIYLTNTSVKQVGFKQKLAEISLIKPKTELNYFFQQQDIIRYDNLLNLFRVNKSQNYVPKWINLKKNVLNQLSYFSVYALGPAELSVLLGVLRQFQQVYVNTLPVNYIIREEDFTIRQVKIDIPMLTRNLSCKDGGAFRRNLRSSLEKLAAVTVKYYKDIGENIVCEGTSNLLSYYSIKNKNQLQIVVQINPTTLNILTNATANYSLLHLDTFFSLKKGGLRTLFYHLTILVPINGKTPTIVGLQTLVNQIFFIDPLKISNGTNRTRKHRVKAWLETFQTLKIPG
jgi:hypothetical protein